MPVATPTKKLAAKKAAPKKTTAKKPTPIVYEHYPRTPGHWPAVKLPVNFAECDGIYMALDLITLAAEAGQLTQENWVRECFVTVESFEAFLDEFSSYDDCYRIIDRWWDALAHLAGYESCEEGFITTGDMADRLRDAAAESGQL